MRFKTIILLILGLTLTSCIDPIGIKLKYPEVVYTDTADIQFQVLYPGHLKIDNQDIGELEVADGFDQGIKATLNNPENKIVLEYRFKDDEGKEIVQTERITITKKGYDDISKEIDDRLREGKYKSTIYQISEKIADESISEEGRALYKKKLEDLQKGYDIFTKMKGKWKYKDVDGEYTTFEFNTKTYDYLLDDTMLSSIPKKFNTPDDPMNMGTFTPLLRYVGYEGGNKIRCIRYLNDIKEPLGEFVFEK